MLVPYTADADASPAPLTISSSIRSSSTTNTVYTSTRVTVIPRATSTTLHTSSQESVYGDPVTLTALISSEDERELAGPVTFTDNLGNTLCTVPVKSNAASCTTGALEVGDRLVVAHYAGQTNDGPSDSAQEPVLVTRIPSALVATVSPARSEYGTPIAFNATGPTAGSTGTITFIDTETDTALCHVKAAGSNVVACSPTAPPGVGEHAFRAVYTPTDAVHIAPTTTPDIPYQVDRVTLAATTLINGNRTATATYGAPVPLSISGLPATATGSVNFTEGGSLLCVADLPASHCTPSSRLPTGDHIVQASYSGDFDYAPVAAASATLAVTKQSISTPTVRVNAAETYGQRTRFDLADSTIPTDATGTVTYLLDNTTPLCSVALPATACVAAIPVGVGVHGATAFYSGDGNHEKATSPTRLFRITKVATVLAITGTPTTAWGTRSHVAISGLPQKATGTITVAQGKETLCTVHLPDSTCTIDSIEPGTATIKGTYSGDSTYAGSSAATHVTVTSTHTHNNKPQESHDPNAAVATWPAVRGADMYMVNVYADARQRVLLRTVTIPAPRTSTTIDQLRPSASYWYRITTFSETGVVLSMHDAFLRTADSPTPVVEKLAETGPKYEPKTLGLSLLILFGVGGFLLYRSKLRLKNTTRR
nr:Ig-like domain-containing protein [Frondihabitans sp. VKM Ac-2883]